LVLSRKFRVIARKKQQDIRHKKNAYNGTAMNTKKLANLIGTVFIVGMLVTFLASDSDLRALLGGLEVGQLETLLNYLKLGLGFIALAVLTGFLFYRAATRKEGKRLEAGRDDGGASDERK
jgi:hypothetical protein